MAIRLETEPLIRLDDDVVQCSMPDVNFLVDALEISDVVKKTIVEHLKDQFDKVEHLGLVWREFGFGFRFEPCELLFTFLFEMLQSTTETVHVFE